MKLAVVPPYDTAVLADPAGVVRPARHAEDLGFESLYLAEHAIVTGGHARDHHYTPDGSLGLPDDTPFPDPLAVFGHVAALTTRLRLGTGTLILPQQSSDPAREAADGLRMNGIAPDMTNTAQVSPMPCRYIVILGFLSKHLVGRFTHDAVRIRSAHLRQVLGRFFSRMAAQCAAGLRSN